MKSRLMRITLLSSLLCSSANASGFFGADIGSTFGYPNSSSSLATILVNAGYSSAQAQQRSGSLGFSIFGGNWLSENVGWEFGYAYLGGGIDGQFSTTGPTTAGTYDYTASAFHGAFLGGTNVGSGKIYGKVGLYRASTESKAAYTVGSTSSFTGSNANMGLMLGAGYEAPINDKLSTRFGADLYNGVDFYEVSNEKAVKQTMYRIGFGLVYNY